MFSDKTLFDLIGRGMSYVATLMVVVLALGVVGVLLVGWGLWWAWSYFT